MVFERKFQANLIFVFSFLLAIESTAWTAAMVRKETPTFFQVAPVRTGSSRDITLKCCDFVTLSPKS